ncbi:TetR/AcrR family transcriptional regulator [Saccharopolyspora flava]|uniref:Transcriptional regulator, TetR family n=1 Tax=Saccharopolyspora flava TaxID=95161 RepID=A0A1I6SSY1_9PSEU|nr:TetR/AcrR family transcriptional regulator [Saccharopolyspora flava]SFS80016.1 transcriptional regulator, TetR family [Saccharopolyspora flava]
MTTTDTTPRLRADARRNRDRIISAAQAVFTERGTEVPMEEVARSAGVGVGTLYRRFPDRDSLIRAVAQDAFDTVLEDTRATIAQKPDAWTALSQIMHRGLALRTVVRLTVLSSRARAIINSDPNTEAVNNQFLELVEDLVRRAQADGKLREDISTGDIAVLSGLALQGMQALPEELRTIAPARYIAVLLDGLRAENSRPLPGRPISADEVIIRTPEVEF